jgi:hypothetical protein
MIYEDICTKREYEVNGVKKVSWLKCGTLRTNDTGKRFIELNHLPDVAFYVFPKKEKEKTTEEAWLENEG